MGNFWTRGVVTVCIVAAFVGLFMTVLTVAEIKMSASNSGQRLAIPQAFDPFLKHPAIVQARLSERIVFRHLVHNGKEGWMMASFEPTPEIRALYRLLPNMCDPVLHKYPYQKGTYFGWNPIHERFMFWTV